MLLTVKEKDYHIPEKWTEVKLGQYQDYMEKVIDIEDESTLNKIAISCFTGLSMNLIDKIRKTDIDAVNGYLNELAKKKMNSTLNLIIEVEGVDYGFHPKLKDLTFGEFVDLDNYLSDPWKNMHYIMAVLYRPIVKQKKNKYNIEEYDSDKTFERAQKFKDVLSVATVNGAANFFLSIGLEYQSVMQLSLKQQQKKMKKMKENSQIKTTSTTNGVGTE